MSNGPSQPDVHEWRNGPYAISTDRARLDVELIHGFLAREFWDTVGITREVLQRAIEHSLCFGVYEEERQVGFARVVTDRATFAFLTDDFVVESHRGRGLARWLLRCVLQHPDLQGLRRRMLVTRDPRLYREAGFGPPREPETHLEILDSSAYGSEAAAPRSPP